jgi:hypothetical protein
MTLPTYMVDRFHNMTDVQLNARLDSLYKDGWELVSSDGDRLIFKQRQEDKQPANRHSMAATVAAMFEHQLKDRHPGVVVMFNEEEAKAIVTLLRSEAEE